MIVPRILTPVPLAGLPEALDVAHHGLHGYSLDDAAYILAEAQLRLEHGTAGGMLRGLWCYCFGNHDATAADRADPNVTLFSTVPEHEVDRHGRGYSAVHVRRAYSDLDAGLRGYWQTLSGGYSEAYDVLVSAPGPADAEAFARALNGRGYYTASVESYARALEGLVAEATPTWETVR